MATSGTYTFDPTADDLLVEAWERCGLTGQVLNGEAARSARRSLQLMLVHWQNRGLNLWQVEAVPFTLAAGQETLATAPATSDVLEVTVVVSAPTTVLLAPISRDQWAALPNRTLRSWPNSYWSERVNPVPVLHFYPLPSVSIAGTYWRVRLPQDVGALGNTLDAPILWGEALSAGLAARLAVKFAPDRAAGLKAEAEEAFAAAAGENRERVPLTILPVRRR
jgi:hypothetical protein